MNCEIKLKPWNTELEIYTHQILVRNFKDDYIFFHSPIGGLSTECISRQANKLINQLDKMHEKM